MSARFSIGIDLGTTNSALAFVPIDGDALAEMLSIPQWESASRLTEATILPSFLYLPEEEIARQLGGRDGGPGEWLVGRIARGKAAECPGRVAHSAKSWLCHPGADRTEAFLPWGSDEIAAARKISPIRASALILNALRGAWDNRFAAGGSDCRFDAQDVTVTVPASFDAAAQRLTLAAAEEAGFPATVRLLEEPQAAFYAWLERHDAVRDLWHRLPGGAGKPRHVLVVDMGGGTSDFSLFEIRAPAAGPIPAIRRIAVSDHILLGGDNIDLAIAHRLERRLVDIGGKLAAGQWDYLVARCRDLKERALASDGAAADPFPVAVPGRGASLLAGTHSAEVSRGEIEEILFDGFFPVCDAGDRPYKPAAALREWGLPFAADSAVTRHLAEFLAGRPRADAVLFNGGSLYPPRLRQRLVDRIAVWQGGSPPLVLANADPDLAVARGAARFGKLLHGSGERIEAGAGHSVFLALQGPSTAGGGDKASPKLICILPHGAQAEESFAISDQALELRVNRAVRFQPYTSTRHEHTPAGTVVYWKPQKFRALPPLETIARLDSARRDDGRRTLPVELTARLNELGLLHVACRSTAPGIRQTWPLQFNLRAQPATDEQSEIGAVSAPAAANVAAAAVDSARQRLWSLFADARSRQGGLTVARVFKDLERALGLAKADWNWVVNRTLWSTLEKCMPNRAASIEHEETWIALAGFLLRPGFGAPLDEDRIDGLWRLNQAGLCFPGKRIRTQAYILWRRVAGGLDRDRQEQLFAAEIETVRRRSDPPPELIRLLGSLERIGGDAKAELISRFTDAGRERAREKRHAAPYFAALGLLLNRAPLYAGPETVVPPDQVERVFEAFAPLDWRDPELAELATLFLRAARVVDNRALDVPLPVRQRIATRLEKAGVPPLRVAKVRDFLPVEGSERLSLFGEALPPGLVLGTG
jgi:molecular chaperone DnaK (HSP70)